MKFLLNGLAIGQDTPYHLEAPISGLEQSPVRLGYGDWSGRDGGYVSSQYYTARTIVLSGFYIGSTCEEADTLRYNLAQTLDIRQSLPLFITSFSGNHYFTQTYLKDFKMDIINPKHGKYQITLIAPDPYLYDAGDGVDPNSGWNNLPIYKLVGGGYVTEYDMPVTWTPGTTPAIATNTGDVTIYPQFKITGVVQNPRITNYNANKFVQINVTTTSPTDEIIIDMKQRTVTLNGGNILAYRTSDSVWWGLGQGNNTIEFTSSGPSDVNFGTLRWRAAYLGV